MSTKLNKPLWINICRLKLLRKDTGPVKFILEKTPFDGFDEVEQITALDEYVVIGRVFPQSDIYRESSFRIEIKLTLKYPLEAPVVRFLTPIYHPNIEQDGTFCHHLLTRTSRWKQGTTLVEVVKAIINHIDEPDPDYAVNFDIGKEYTQNRTEFNRKALEMTRKHILPRD